MYLPNKYTQWYHNIITRARLRVIESGTYTEMHHIIPKSLGGNNANTNLVKLTAREHFICHWLLTKMVISVSHKQKMAYACKRMMYRTNSSQPRYRLSSRIYENLKLRLNIELKGRIFTDAWRAKLSASAKIRANNESVDVKHRRSVQMKTLGQSKKGVKKPDQTGDKNPFAQEDVKQKLKSTNLLKYGYENPALIPYVCEYCKKSGTGIAGYKRWHGSNCKSIKQ